MFVLVYVALYGMKFIFNSLNLAEVVELLIMVRVLLDVHIPCLQIFRSLIFDMP